MGKCDGKNFITSEQFPKKFNTYQNINQTITNVASRYSQLGKIRYDTETELENKKLLSRKEIKLLKKNFQYDKNVKWIY